MLFIILPFNNKPIPLKGMGVGPIYHILEQDIWTLKVILIIKISS